MSILNQLKKINELSTETKLKVTCRDGTILYGFYNCFVSELDNEPEEAQLDIINISNNGLVGLLESEIEKIEEMK